MLACFGLRHNGYCDGLARRNFLRAGALVEARVSAGFRQLAENPLLPKIHSPRRRGRIRIIFWTSQGMPSPRPVIRIST